MCVRGGIYYAAEVKLSAISFVEKQEEIDKFMEKIELIHPDVALLIFEQYCESEDDSESTKAKLEKVLKDIAGSVGKGIRVESMVASESSDFKEYPADLGHMGKRVHGIFDSVDNHSRKRNLPFL